MYFIFIYVSCKFLQIELITFRIILIYSFLRFFNFSAQSIKDTIFYLKI